MAADVSGNRVDGTGRHGGNAGESGTEDREGDHALGSHERERPPLGGDGIDHGNDLGRLRLAARAHLVDIRRVLYQRVLPRTTEFGLQSALADLDLT